VGTIPGVAAVRDVIEEEDSSRSQSLDWNGDGWLPTYPLELLRLQTCMQFSLLLSFTPLSLPRTHAFTRLIPAQADRSLLKCPG
jgi:hypothetical protein